jgi:hydroxymethylglutaryl-CoA lyase
METAVKIIECPRDAWQGLASFIPTDAKIAYLQGLIEAGFHHIDAVSFVAPKYVPQMADSEQVLEGLYSALTTQEVVDSSLRRWEGGLESMKDTRTDQRPNPAPSSEIIGIVVNEHGLERCLRAPSLSTIGYPYSVSAHFRRANANMSKAQSQALVTKLQRAVSAPNAPFRNLVVYISMAFGNNYDEPWGPEIVIEAVEWLRGIGVSQVSLADTIGTASPEEVGSLYKAVSEFIDHSGSELELGVHLHSRPESAADKVLAAYEAGCRRFDSALTGLGGCPFAGDDLVGNIPTEVVLSTLSSKGAETGIEPWALLSAVEATKELRKKYAP